MNTYGEDGGDGGSSLVEVCVNEDNTLQSRYTPQHRGGRRKKRGDNVSTYKVSPKFLTELHTWGDDFHIHDEWPMNMDTIRILGGNMKGISHYNDMIEWEMILG